MQPRESLEPGTSLLGKSLGLRELAASPPARLADGLPRKSLPLAAQLRLAPATTRSIAVAEKLGQGRAGWTRGRGSTLWRAIQRQSASTPSAPAPRVSPGAALRSRAASGPRSNPINPGRTSDDPQKQSESQRPERRRGTPAELVVPLNTS